MSRYLCIILLVSKKVVFVAQQFHQTTTIEVPEEPEILLDSGSTISLFKDDCYLEDVKNSKNRLIMETNAGSRAISRIGTIPGHGPVWVDEEAICNLLALCDLVSRGHRVKYDSDIGDWFDVISRDGNWMRFIANDVASM